MLVRIWSVNAKISFSGSLVALLQRATGAPCLPRSRRPGVARLLSQERRTSIPSLLMSYYEGVRFSGSGCCHKGYEHTISAFLTRAFAHTVGAMTHIVCLHSLGPMPAILTGARPHTFTFPAVGGQILWPLVPGPGLSSQTGAFGPSSWLSGPVSGLPSRMA